uniref:Putative secreted protein n=1 Tax=Ixodes ricinus TaxID=34613 RepID=A0A147BAZ6_IXORI
MDSSCAWTRWRRCAIVCCALSSSRCRVSTVSKSSATLSSSKDRSEASQSVDQRSVCRRTFDRRCTAARHLVWRGSAASGTTSVATAENLSAPSDSSSTARDGLTLTMSETMPPPTKKACITCVSLLSRKGARCSASLPSRRASKQRPSTSKELLMRPASLRRLPTLPVLPGFSEPARSHNVRQLTAGSSDESSHRTNLMLNMQWLLLELWLSRVSAMLRLRRATQRSA